MTPAPELFVTNFNPRFTGVSATAAAVVRAQQGMYDLRLVGRPLPGCPVPISKRAAFAASRRAPDGRPFAIWHVRRNPEMRAALWARDVLRYPLRIVFTSAAQRSHSAFPRWLIARMDAVIATTPKAAEFVPHVRAVVPHGVDTDIFHPADDRAAAWRALGHGGARGVATVGRVRPEKGTDLFVDAMLRVLPAHPDLVALVIGRAAPEHRGFARDLKARVAQAGLADRLLFIGELASDAMPALMRALSLLVALPRYEGYGMTPLEAMASAVPFVASDTGYYRSFAGQGQVARIVGVGEVEQAAVEVGGLLDDAARLAQMSAEAVAAVRAGYGLEREVAGIGAVYEELWANG